MKNFEQFVGIDWSGAKSPQRTSSIAVARIDRKSTDVGLLPDIRSRMEVFDFISLINKRTLIGIDCNFGYAHDIVKKHLGENKSAQDLWGIVDQVNVANDNFFAGSFWTHQNYRDDFWTAGKMRDGFEMPKRTTEIICSENGYGKPESPFKLIGAKQVGKDGLAGMRLAHQLKNKFGETIAVWPFDQNINEAKIVMTEIYPQQFIMRSGQGTQKLRNVDDLNKALHFYGVSPIKDEGFSDHDADALVSAAGLRYLCGQNKDVPHNLAQPKDMTIEAQQYEGWIFGVGDQ
ncbi:MAG: hypothetical protein AAGB32_04765 [Pseudomonadota bacterium]